MFQSKQQLSRQPIPKLSFLFFITLSVYSNPTELYLNKTENRILKAEESLNTEIETLRIKLEAYYTLLDNQSKKNPSNVQLKKGHTVASECDFKKSESLIDCMQVEIQNFKFNPDGSSEGDFKKSMTLFYDANHKLVKIKSFIYSDSFLTAEKQIIEILDTNPQDGNIEESVMIRFQTPEKIPALSNSIQYYEKKFIPLKSIENTKNNPLRNQLKREAYIKHLKSFEQLLGRLESTVK